MPILQGHKMQVGWRIRGISGHLFRLEKPLGLPGLLGQVFLARAEDGTFVAAKALRPNRPATDRTRFFQEAETLERLRQVEEAAGSHYAVRLLDLAAQDAPEPFLVLELAKGRNVFYDLVDRVADWETQPLPEQEVLEIAWHFAQALTLAHRAGICYDDMKLENLFWQPEKPEPLRVIDWNVVSPVAARGVSGDWARFGARLYEMLTGKRLGVDTEGRLMAGRLEDALNWEQVACGLQQIMRRALHPQITQRYAQDEDFLADLQREYLAAQMPVGDLVAQAQKALEIQRYFAAKALLKRAAKQSPEHPLIQHLLTEVDQGTRRMQESDLATGQRLLQRGEFGLASERFSAVYGANNGRDASARRWSWVAKLAQQHPTIYAKISPSLERALVLLQPALSQLSQEQASEAMRLLRPLFRQYPELAELGWLASEARLLLIYRQARLRAIDDLAEQRCSVLTALEELKKLGPTLAAAPDLTELQAELQQHLQVVETQIANQADLVQLLQTAQYEAAFATSLGAEAHAAEAEQAWGRAEDACHQIELRGPSETLVEQVAAIRARVRVQLAQILTYPAAPLKQLEARGGGSTTGKLPIRQQALEAEDHRKAQILALAHQQITKQNFALARQTLVCLESDLLSDDLFQQVQGLKVQLHHTQFAWLLSEAEQALATHDFETARIHLTNASRLSADPTDQDQCHALELRLLLEQATETVQQSEWVQARELLSQAQQLLAQPLAGSEATAAQQRLTLLQRECDRAGAYEAAEQNRTLIAEALQQHAYQQAQNLAETTIQSLREYGLPEFDLLLQTLKQFVSEAQERLEIRTEAQQIFETLKQFYLLDNYQQALYFVDQLAHFLATRSTEDPLVLAWQQQAHLWGLEMQTFLKRATEQARQLSQTADSDPLLGQKFLEAEVLRRYPDYPPALSLKQTWEWEALELELHADEEDYLRLAAQVDALQDAFWGDDHASRSQATIQAQQLEQATLCATPALMQLEAAIESLASRPTTDLQKAQQMHRLLAERQARRWVLYLRNLLYQDDLKPFDTKLVETKPALQPFILPVLPELQSERDSLEQIHIARHLQALGHWNAARTAGQKAAEISSTPFVLTLLNEIDATEHAGAVLFKALKELEMYLSRLKNSMGYAGESPFYQLQKTHALLKESIRITTTYSFFQKEEYTQRILQFKQRYCVCWQNVAQSALTYWKKAYPVVLEGLSAIAPAESAVQGIVQEIKGREILLQARQDLQEGRLNQANARLQEIASNLPPTDQALNELQTIIQHNLARAQECKAQATKAQEQAELNAAHNFIMEALQFNREDTEAREMRNTLAIRIGQALSLAQQAYEMQDQDLCAAIKLWEEVCQLYQDGVYTDGNLEARPFTLYLKEALAQHNRQLGSVTAKLDEQDLVENLAELQTLERVDFIRQEFQQLREVFEEKATFDWEDFKRTCAIILADIAEINEQMALRHDFSPELGQIFQATSLLIAYHTAHDELFHILSTPRKERPTSWKTQRTQAFTHLQDIWAALKDFEPGAETIVKNLAAIVEAAYDQILLLNNLEEAA